MINDLVTWAVVARGEIALCDRHADAISEALAERASRRLHSGRQSALRMSGSFTFPLAEQLKLFERQIIASEMEQTVKQHRAMARGEDEAVTIHPILDWSDYVLGTASITHKP